MMDRRQNREKKYHLWGWILFIICAVFFIASSLKNRDMLGLAASLIFLIACLFFLTPLFTQESGPEKPAGEKGPEDKSN